MTDTPHFALPFQWSTAAGGGLAALEVEQESMDEIASCAEAIIRTVQGQRTSLPTFGIPALEFNEDPALTSSVITQALQEFEPRVAPLISAAPDTGDDLTQIVEALIAPSDNEDGSG
jgi:phage baseplate assembly protein W